MTSDISIRREDGVVVVTPVGEMDAVTSPALAQALDEVLTAPLPRGVVVDLAKVGFCDSRCIGVLVSAFRQARDLGLGLIVAEPQQQVNRLFVIAGIDQVIPISASTGTAVESLRR
ncbi:anti-sigma factor antagonist [Nocardiopsis terrae]|uniref:Anti-sigma factor antagonist n=1 Tax=Nocardiopsis terrae TaxID=372655 RepID=A0ABR9HM37_9ACTN|nr:STAS domain-containing protein [Nocardiopsis terrae]MBE1460083.1 anti-sigma B factor antagonist [Nocardiopsis terrae]GHC69604.1 anti-sigma factor antagonist [Nocardiopsis terrae]